MKKLIILIITLLTISTASFAQDTTINLPKSVAKEVVKDLIRLDSISYENKILKSNFDLLQQNSVLKDSIIVNKNTIIDLYKEKEAVLNMMIGVKDQQVSNATKAVSDLNKELKRTKRRKTLSEIGATAIIVGLGYLLVTK
jgi:hypothetical protein